MHDFPSTTFLRVRAACSARSHVRNPGASTQAVPSRLAGRPEFMEDDDIEDTEGCE
jgi:hypothetical protein